MRQELFEEVGRSRDDEARRIASDGKPVPAPEDYALSAYRTVGIALPARDPEKLRDALVLACGRLLAALELLGRRAKVAGRKCTGPGY